jgi:hypothetical protein
MKIAVLGNSHIASLKLAWEKLKLNYPNLELVFFGARGRDLLHLKVENARLIPTRAKTEEQILFTSGGLHCLDTQAFDAFLVYGPYHVEGFLAFTDTFKVGNFADSKRRTLSLSCFAQLCHDRLQESLLFQLVAQTRSANAAAPIFVAPAPFPGDNCLDEAASKWRVFASGDCASMQAGYYEGLRSVFSPFNAEFLPQPEHTIINSLFSKRNYAKGSVRLTAGLATQHPSDNYWHMNQAYGEIFLTEAFSPKLL